MNIKKLLTYIGFYKVKPRYKISPNSHIIIDNNYYNEVNPNQNTKRVMICSTRKKCIDCGRPTVYKVNQSTLIYGWRVCWEHMPNGARSLLQYYYENNLSDIK